MSTQVAAAAMIRPSAPSGRITVTICVPLDIDPVPLIREAADEIGGATIEVHHDPTLLPPQRFPADHRGRPEFVRSEADDQRWRAQLAAADVALGFPGDGPEGLRLLAEVAPRLRWVQGTAAGAGEQLAAARLPADVAARVRVTSAAGLHAVPLAGFAVFGLLSFAKDADLLAAAGQAREWRPRWPMRRLRGSHVLVLGLGGIGLEVARLCSAFGCRVTGVRRNPAGAVPDGIERVAGLGELDALLPDADAVVVTLPGTGETRGLLDQARLALLPTHAVMVNVGRGSVIDSSALAARLDAHALRGAVLDVTDEEPLPATSPLWGRPNVVISPHTAALTTDEDERIVRLFTDNLRRFLSGTPLRNLVDPAAGY